MKKHLPYLLYFLTACGTETSSSTPLVQQKDSTQDTAIVSNELEENFDTTNKKLIDLLYDPIDLEAYKKKWGSSNSGGINIKGLYEPDTIGFQYRYMFFWKLRNHIKSHPSESELFKGFRIIVFKYGEKAGDFYDSNEELIAIESALDNTTLGDFNFYGKTQKEISDEIGPPYFELDDISVYCHSDRAISLHFSDKKVDWFKYARLNKQLKPETEIPEFLTRWND